MRLRWFQLHLALLLLAAAPAPRAQDAAAPKPVRSESYRGWDGSVILESVEAAVKAVVVPAVGGRILHYALDGDSIIHEPSGSEGLTLTNAKGPLRPGGYQCDIGPEVRGIPRHDRLWLGPHRVEFPKPLQVLVTSEPDPTVGIQMSKEIFLDPESGDLGITQTMKNTSRQDVSFCLWDRTLVKGGGFAFFPLAKRSVFKQKWSVRHKVGDQLVYEGTHPSSPNVKIIDGMVVARLSGEATKIGADSDAGWVAYARGTLLFVKYFPVTPGGNYTDGGNTVEIYWDAEKGELEPLSPEVRLAPGETYSFPEKWTLIELEKDVSEFDQIKKIAKKVPPSPFKK
jgi:hypothetical protein